MSKLLFSSNLNIHLKRKATKEERRMAWAAFRLLGLTKINQLNKEWYIK